MTDTPTDGQTDQLVKARWLAIGLSQTDLAEVLGAASQPTTDDGEGSTFVDVARLMQVAQSLEIPIDLLCRPAIGTGRQEPDASSTQRFGSLQAVLALRLLLAFQDLSDLRTKEMLVHLAEQIVKRQANRSRAGD